MTGEYPYLELLNRVLAEQDLALGQQSVALLLQARDHRMSIFVLSGGLITGRGKDPPILAVPVDEEQEEIRLTAPEVDNLA